jgi:hypothetical protein
LFSAACQQFLIITGLRANLARVPFDRLDAVVDT